MNKIDDEKLAGSSRYKRVCGGVNHPTNLSPSLYLLDLKKRKGISRTDYENILSQEIVFKHTRYICKSCLKLFNSGASSRNHSDDENVRSQEPDLNLSSKLCSEKSKELNKRCLELGKLLNDQINNDTEICKASLKSFEDIIDFDSRKWLEDRPQAPLNLLSQICKIDLETAPEIKVVVLSKIVELIYSCKN